MRTLYEPKHHDYELPQGGAAHSAASLDTTDAIDASPDAIEIRTAERRRVAHDLHDTVVQPLTALLISMETVSQSDDAEISPAQKAGRVSLHLVDENGVDRGALQEVQISGVENH